MAGRWDDEECKWFYEYAYDDHSPKFLRRVMREERTYERRRIMAVAARVLTEAQVAKLKAALKEQP